MSEKIKSLCNSKPAAIFGCGSSGLAAKKLLDFLGIESVFYAENISKKIAELGTKAFANFDKNHAKEHSLVIYSPVFRPDHKWLKLARTENATLVCEPDLSALAWSGKIFAITGTNGKTTLTKFLTKSLNDAGFDAISAGNIGEPLSSFCPKFGTNPNKIAVCELSSFQTSNLQFLKPNALIWTNFAPDHLDWHVDMKEYFEAKMNLLKATGDNPIFVGSSVEKSAKEYGVNLPKHTKILDEENPLQAPAPFESSIQSRNFQMALEFAKTLGLNENNLCESAKAFNLPDYRFSMPIEIDGVRYYNDSKATNAHAAIAAIEELKNESDLIWIGGGKDKLCDLNELINAITKHVKAVVLIGQSAEKLEKSLIERDFCKVFICKSMKDAVEKSANLASKGSAVLFSPAFSSFGMFAGYAERGKSFKNEVLCLKNLK